MVAHRNNGIMLAKISCTPFVAVAAPPCMCPTLVWLCEQDAGLLLNVLPRPRTLMSDYNITVR